MGSPQFGQSPWAVMNQLAEKNLQVWQDFQQNLVGQLGRTPNGEKADDKTRR